MQVDEEVKHTDVRELSKNAMRDICDPAKQAEIKDKVYIVQANDVKVFTDADNKKNIRQR